MNLPRLTKEEIQKSILSLIGLVVLLYCYSAFLLGPLNQARTRMISAMADGEKKLADGKKTLKLSSDAPFTVRDGLGKTHTLANRVTRLLLDGAKPERILCLTYTKAAAAEMQGRLFDRLGMRELQLAVTIASRHRVCRKELVDAKDFADERGERWQTSQLKFALRVARLIG